MKSQRSKRARKHRKQARFLHRFAGLAHPSHLPAKDFRAFIRRQAEKEMARLASQQEVPGSPYSTTQDTE